MQQLPFNLVNNTSWPGCKHNTSILQNKEVALAKLTLHWKNGQFGQTTSGLIKFKEHTKYICRLADIDQVL